MTLGQLVALYCAAVAGIILLILATHVALLERRMRLLERRRAEELVAWLEKQHSKPAGLIHYWTLPHKPPPSAGVGEPVCSDPACTICRPVQ